MSNNFIEASIKKIQEASENNKLIVFVGAGVSANSGMPTWSELIEDMAGELGGFDSEKPQDLYLKIPQYYFNERGEKEYFDKLNEVFFQKKYKPNFIHKEIFKLKPSHIITTNYDTLLEESAISEGQFYHTVKQDLDLAYNTLNKTIIKMHGDFENRNIVLKEDDYLNYSFNFTLIENYIKSLIATNTVLFIGYSVNDANFNLIFQWVKSILKNHFQPAYLIESSKQYLRMEHEYYKNRGINILYYDEISHLKENKVFDESNWRGNRLYDVISHFSNYDKANRKNDLQIIYERLIYFEKMNFIMPDQILQNQKWGAVIYNINGNRTLDILEENNILYRVFSESDKYTDDWRFKSILSIFEKSNIRGISIEGKVIFELKNEKYYLTNLENSIIENDSFLNPLNVDNFTESNEEDYFLMLKKASRYVENECFLEAFKYYKIISSKSFQDKEYLIYYISEFNRKHVGKYALHHINSNQREELKSEIDELDLNDVFYKLPVRERKGLKFLTDIHNFNFIYKVQNSLNKQLNQIKGTKRTVERGGFSINNSLNKNFTITKNLWLFLNANYLCLDKYLEVQSVYFNFIEGVFASYSTNSEAARRNSLGISVRKIEMLSLFEVYIIITKLKTSELENTLLDYNIKEIDITEEAYQYIIKVLEKMVENILNQINIKKSELYICNLLTLLSKVKLNSNQANDVATKIISLIKEKKFFMYLKYINKYIVSVANKNLITQDVILDYLENYLKIYQHNRKIIDIDSSGFYENLALIYKDNDKFPIDNQELSNCIGTACEYYEKNDKDSLNEILLHIIIPIFKKMKEKHRKKVIHLSQKILNDIKKKEKTENNNTKSLQSIDIKFYYCAVMNGIISSDKSINKRGSKSNVGVR